MPREQRALAVAQAVLKVLPEARLADPERRARFIQEAKAASALNHSTETYGLAPPTMRDVKRLRQAQTTNEVLAGIRHRAVLATVVGIYLYLERSMRARSTAIGNPDCFPAPKG